MVHRLGKIIRGLTPIVFAALVAASASVRAQDDNVCPCSSIVISVDASVRCKVTVCTVIGDVIACTTIAPGSSASAQCTPGALYYIRDCHNQLVAFDPFSAECVRGIGAGPGCCTVDVCRVGKGCPALVSITPSILDVCPCL